MTDEDINKIGVLIDSRLGEFRDEIKDSISASEKNLRAFVGDSISASEKSLRGEIDSVENSLRQEILASEKRVVKGFVDFVSDSLMPLIDDKAGKTDIDRIEHKLDNLSARTMESSHRLDVIESIPVIAHELKIRRSKKA